MVAPSPSKLDNRQMLQGAYDEATGSFRTTSNSTIVNADIDVALDSAEDHVAIRSSTGIEIGINPDGSIDVIEGLKSGGVYGPLTLTSANTAYEAKVGVSSLSGRKALHITITSAGIYWGLDASVTTINGTPTFKNQTLVFSIDPSSSFKVFLVSASTNSTVRIVEVP